jgi:hypothetical protein
MIELHAQSPDQGMVDGKNNSTTYETKYAVSDEIFEKYKTKQIKKLRIFWSETRFFDHDVNYPNALVEQAKCLD